jgi:RNA polymerase sigma-70 factor, ECF subfamily
MGLMQTTTTPARQSDALHQQIIALLPDLRAFARFLTRDRTQADDLVQETLVRALGALDQYQEATKLKAWLFTILRNTFYEQARRRRTEQNALKEASTEEPMEAGGQESGLAIADLHRVLWTLPPLLRESLVLVGAQGLAHEEAAAICGVPVGTMKARVSRARTQLAQALRADDTPPA